MEGDTIIRQGRNRGIGRIAAVDGRTHRKTHIGMIGAESTRGGGECIGACFVQCDSRGARFVVILGCIGRGHRRGTALTNYHDKIFVAVVVEGRLQDNRNPPSGIAVGEDIVVDSREGRIRHPRRIRGCTGHVGMPQLEGDVVRHGVGSVALEPYRVDIARTSYLCGSVDHLGVGGSGIAIKGRVIPYRIERAIVDRCKSILQWLSLKGVRQ